MALTPDGRTAFTASYDDTVRVWRLANLNAAQYIAERVQTSAAKALHTPLNREFTPPQQQPRACVLKPIANLLQDILFLEGGELDDHIAGILQFKFIPAAKLFFAACVEDSRNKATEMGQQYRSTREKHRTLYEDTLRLLRQESLWGEIEERANSLSFDCEAQSRRKEQTADTVVDLLVHARAVTERYDKLLNGVCQRAGATPHVCKNKGLFRILEKLALAKPVRHPSCVQDVVRGMVECTTLAKMAVVLRTLRDLDSELEVNGVTGGLDDPICITRCKVRLSPEGVTSGGWSDIMVNFYFTTDPNQHVCEVQLVLTDLFLVRKEMGAHKMYAIFRAALELCEAVGIDPESC
jgi:hypothetical protein